MQPGDRVVVFGLGGIGLNVIQGARLAGAGMIVGIDVNPARRAIAEKFGMTHFVNPKEVEGDLVPYLVNLTRGGADFSFECVGNVKLMRQALECCQRGWGTCVIIGVAGAGQEISTRPFQLVTGRTWKGTAFGGAKSRRDVPKIVDWYMDKQNQHRRSDHAYDAAGENQRRFHPDARGQIDSQRGAISESVARCRMKTRIDYCRDAVRAVDFGAGMFSVHHKKSPQQEYTEALMRGNSMQASQVWLNMSPEDRMKFARGEGLQPDRLYAGTDVNQDDAALRKPIAAKGRATRSRWRNRCRLRSARACNDFRRGRIVCRRTTR